MPSTAAASSAAYTVVLLLALQACSKDAAMSQGTPELFTAEMNVPVPAHDTVLGSDAAGSLKLDTMLLPEGNAVGQVMVNVPGVERIEMLVRRSISADSTEQTFEGFSADSAQSLHLVKGARVAGRLRSSDGVVIFRSRADGTLIFDRDTSRYVPEAPPLAPPPAPSVAPAGGRRSIPPDAEKVAMAPAVVCAPRDLVVVVMVARNALRVASREILSVRIETAADLASGLHVESDLGAVKAHVAFVDIDAAGNSEAILRGLASASTPIGQRLRAEMQVRRAHAGVLVVGSMADNPCGRAFVTTPTRTAPFAVVRAGCLNYLTMEHELTHILGANHHPPAEAYSDDAYGHSDAAANFLTIEEACPEGSTCSERVALLADPTKLYRQVPRGSPTSNTARVFRHSLCTLTRGS